MGILKRLFKGGIGEVLNPVKDIIDEFNLSGEEKGQLMLQMKSQLTSVFASIEATHQAEMTAKKDIMIAELNQGDNFTKRARPTIIYWGIALITFGYVVFPLVIGTILAIQGDLLVAIGDGATEFKDLPTIPLPEQFWWAWGGVVSVYAMGRSAEKFGVRNKMVEAITGGSVLMGSDR